MEPQFKMIVERVFSNWTGLKIAVDQGFGGPRSKHMAFEFVDYIVKYLVSESDLELEDIIDCLEDTMDQEFQTVFEDNSIPDVAGLLHKFIVLLRQGNTAQCEAEYNSLPPTQDWLIKPAVLEQTTAPQSSRSSSSSEAEDDAMEEDPGWTKVTRKR